MPVIKKSSLILLGISISTISFLAYVSQVEIVQPTPAEYNCPQKCNVEPKVKKPEFPLHILPSTLFFSEA
jgi:hypothetical protein